MRKLDIGCGRNKLSGCIGIDISKHSDAEYIIDIEKHELPFNDESVDFIFTSHTLEHIENIVFVMNEFWRVLKYGGLLDIHVPHKDCNLAWQDPMHKRYFVPESFKFFCGYYLVKYKLDYGINCIFKDVTGSDEYHDHTDRMIYYPSNTVFRPKYLKMINAILEKNLDWEREYKNEFPFMKEV